MTEPEQTPDQPAETEAATSSSGRITITRTEVHIGGAPAIGRVALETTWNTWSLAERALKKLDPPATSAEVDFLGTLPRERAAKGGFSETKQALAQATGRG